MLHMVSGPISPTPPLQWVALMFTWLVALYLVHLCGECPYMPMPPIKWVALYVPISGPIYSLWVALYQGRGAGTYKATHCGHIRPMTGEGHIDPPTSGTCRATHSRVEYSATHQGGI